MMENIKVILPQLNSQFLNGAKVPHGMSNPVLRLQSGAWVIAVFFYTFNKEHLDTKQIPRPSVWMTADLATGKLIREIHCKNEDFSSQPQNGLYSTENREVAKPGPEYFDEMFAIFDEVRRAIIERGTPDGARYSEYMKKMLAAVPEAFHVFYRELGGEI